MNKKILRLAIPNILSNLSVPLLSSVDTIVVGHLEKVSYLGAIAVGSAIFNFLYLGLGFLRMGTTGITAQYYGKKDDNGIIHTLGRSITTALFMALVFILFQEVIAWISFQLISPTEEVKELALQYFYIRIWAAPATLSLYAFHGWFLGMQNARVPLYLALFVNGANIIFNVTLIYGFGYKSEGVAYGTVAAQYSGLLLAIFLFFRNYSSFLPLLRIKEIFRIDKLRRFFSVNSDIFIRTLLLIFALTFFTAKSAGFGEDLLAANSILMQLWLLIAYGVDGFAFAAESLTGRYTGASDLNNLKKVIRGVFLWGIAISVIFTAVYYLFETPLLNLFTDKRDVIALCYEYMIWIILSPVVNSVCFIWDGIYIGATSTKALRNSMIISVLFIFLPAYYLLKPLIFNDGLWLAIYLFMIARGATLTIMYKKHIILKTAGESS